MEGRDSFPPFFSFGVPFLAPGLHCCLVIASYAAGADKRR